MATVLLLRHAQSVWNAERRWQGWADVPLSEQGERQAAAAGERLRSAGLTAVVSSDLRRARRTAELIAADLELGSVRVDAGFRERDVGEWSGLDAEEMEERFPGQREGWRTGRITQPPGGESTDQLLERVTASLATLERGKGRILVVSHGGVIRALEQHAGVEARTIPVLAGRWFELEDGKLIAGDVVSAADEE